MPRSSNNFQTYNAKTPPDFDDWGGVFELDRKHNIISLKIPVV